jgi:cytochrome c biogenesis protein CcmG, thiol:disulfide interchange protein DsbE
MDQGRARSLIAAAALAAAVVGGIGCATAVTGAPGASGGPVGAPMPPLEVDSFSGRSIRVASYKGRVLLLDVWASWCAPCKQELPMLDAMAERLKARGIDVLAVSVDKDRANVQKFMRAHGRWSLTVAHDPRGEIAELLQPDKMPTSYVVDRAGIVRYVNAGFVPADAPIIEKRLLEVAGE